MGGNKAWPTIVAALIGALVAIYVAGPGIWDQWRSRGDGLIAGTPQIVPVVLTATAALLGAVALAGLLRLVLQFPRRRGNEASTEPIKWVNTGDLYWVGHDLTYAILALETGLPRERILWGLEHALHHARALGYVAGTVEGPLSVLVHEVSSLDDIEFTRERRAQLVQRVWAIINKIGAVSEAHQPGFVAHPPHVGFSRS